MKPSPILIAAAMIPCLVSTPPAPRSPIPEPPSFQPIQPELFGASGAQPNAWADYDGDGDLDLFVGFRYRPNRLYRNDNGVFTDVAAAVGLADTVETRAAAWGDYDGDGDFDLYIGFAAAGRGFARIYRNEESGRRFVDVAAQLGIQLEGTSRQPAWIDYDQDGDLDLFAAFRDRPNRLFRNDGATFTDVTEQTGIGDPRKTVGVAWFDMDQDGDLDLFVANQDGDQDALFRNDDGKFTDIAPQVGVDWPGRRTDQGSVGPTAADYDHDGDFDIFVAAYGPDILWRNEGGGRFVNVAPGTPLAPDIHSTTAVFGDYDNDGWADLYVARYLADQAEAPDQLFHNVRGSFEDATTPGFLAKGGSHGVAWADYDRDGDLDLALANNHREGTHYLYRNLSPANTAQRSIQVRAVDERGRWTLPGAEVRVFDPRSGELLGSGMVDAGGGYCSQGAAPVHVGLPEGTGPLKVEVTVLRGGKRVTITRDGIVPREYRGRTLDIRAP